MRRKSPPEGRAPAGGLTGDRRRTAAVSKISASGLVAQPQKPNDEGGHDSDEELG